MTTDHMTTTKVTNAFKRAPRGKKKTISLTEGDGLDVFDSTAMRDTQNDKEGANPPPAKSNENGAPEATHNFSPSNGGDTQEPQEDGEPSQEDTKGDAGTTPPPSATPGEGDENGAPQGGQTFQDILESLQGAAGETFPPDVIRAFAVSVITKQPFLLIGETGTGKTTLIRAGAEYMQKTLYRVNLNGQTGREDLVGRYILRDNATEWQDGLLVHAMRHGHWILLDELNAALPEVLFCLQAVTERRHGNLGTLILTEHDGEAITPHKDFRIFATCNPPSYVGLKDLNTATLSRFIAGYMPMMSETDAVRHFTNMYPGVSSEDVQLLYTIIENGLQLFQEGELSYCPSMRDIDHICAMKEGGLDTQEALTFGLLHKVMVKDEQEILQKVIEKVDKDFQAYLQKMEQTREVITHKEQLVGLFAQLKDMGGVPDSTTIDKLRAHVDALGKASGKVHEAVEDTVEDTVPF